MGRARPPDGFGGWYDDRQGEEGDRWHRTLIDPGLFARLGALPRGTRVLDLGCGNGYLSRRLARRGASVIAIDASRALIRRAQAHEASEPLGVEYHRADAAHLPMIRTASVDVVRANMSLLDIEDAEGALRESGRVLRPGGRLVASISHPCFDIDTRSAWVVETVHRTTTIARKVSGYRQPHSDTYPWPLPGGRTVRTVGYHRPLSWYARALREAGFVVLALDEPSPQKGFAGGKIPAEWIEAIPMHLVIEARREPGPIGAPAPRRRGPGPSRNRRVRTARRRSRGRAPPA